MVDMIEKFNNAFDRSDFQDYCFYKQQAGNIFTKKIGKYINTKTNEVETIWFTNDPEKMIGCGFTIKSSYSPDSKSFKYLPSFVLQDYIGMIYIKTENTIKKDINGIEFEAPEYKARAFVMIHPKTGYILYKMPTYCSENEYYYAFDSIKEVGFGCIKSYTKAPEIHLDVLAICLIDSERVAFEMPKAHYALCAIAYPCKEYVDNRFNKGYWK